MANQLDELNPEVREEGLETIISKQSEYDIEMGFVDDSTESKESMDKRRFENPFRNTLVANELLAKMNNVQQDINGCLKNIINYVYKVFEQNGYDTTGLENLENSNFEKRTELPRIKSLLGYHKLKNQNINDIKVSDKIKEYIENGYVPIRKGRYWGSGNTPFTGGKVMYFRPNLYRRVEADVEFSDSKWGSRQEYYNNTWFPNPVNPLAPLNHFIFDRNHYDKKHYHDRPYLQTAPEGQNIPIIGPLFGSTIGKIINPPQKMHLEYWQNGFQINPADELPSPLLTQGKTFDNSEYDINTFNRMQQGSHGQSNFLGLPLTFSGHKNKAL